MKKVRLLIATLAVSVMGFATFLAPATPVGATSDDKEAMVNVQDAVDEFADITYDASELDDAAYYSTVIAAADDTIIELERNKAVLAESTEEGEAWVAIKEMTRLISRMQNQLRLMQTNAREGDIEGYDRTVDGYNATADEYFAAVSDYDYNLLDSSETVDATAGFYIIAIWPALGILVGTIVWAAQDKLLEQAKRLRRARALIAVLAGLAFIGLVGMAIVHTLSSAFPVAIAVAVGSLAAMAIALRIKYSEAARKARPAATTTDNTQLVVPVSSFVWLNIFTSGLYATYWTWKAWQVVGKAEHKTYNNTLRALFAVFTNFALFKKLQEHARHSGYKPTYNAQGLAAIVLVATLIGGIAYGDNVNPFLMVVLGAISFVGMLLATLPVVRAYNHYVSKSTQPLFPLRTPYALIAIIVGFVALLALGMILSGVADTV